MSDRKIETRPVKPATGEPIGPMPQPGYYPGFSTLSQQKFWDAKTRAVVLERVQKIPEIRFFTPEEAALLEAICDRVLPQDDRDADHRIPIVPQIDQRLYENSHEGYRYDNMPPDGEAFRLGMQAIDEMARQEHGRGFRELDALQQEELLQSLHRAKPAAAHEIWKRMPVDRFWMLLVSDCVDAYYSHPYAWDEIGFGGPAYPRAYMRLERGEAEPWEVEERRYEWSAPPDSVSDREDAAAAPRSHFGSPGQGGTH